MISSNQHRGTIKLQNFNRTTRLHEASFKLIKSQFLKILKDSNSTVVSLTLIACQINKISLATIFSILRKRRGRQLAGECGDRVCEADKQASVMAVNQLVLINNLLNSQVVDLLFHRYQMKLVELRLQQNMIGDKFFSSTRIQLEQLQSLSIRMNGITNRGMAMFVKIQLPSLTWFNCAMNRLTNCSAKLFAKNQWTQLFDLHLYQNLLQDDFFKGFRADANRHLKNLLIFEMKMGVKFMCKQPTEGGIKNLIKRSGLPLNLAIKVKKLRLYQKPAQEIFNQKFVKAISSKVY